MSWEVREGDCLDVLQTLDAGSVQTCVTSPPYWGLRDYGTATWEGGDSECDHIQTHNLKRDTSGGMLPAGEGTRGTQSSTASSTLPFREVCGKCGAKRIDSQLGLEPTPEEYVANLVGVFREVRRVLRDDGTVWLNLGDSYSGAGGPQQQQTKWPVNGASDTQNAGKTRTVTVGLKNKDLVGIPWRVAFALQADGWWLRSDIIWSKPNPMPESVTDRPTRAHEYIFLLSKSARYFYDADAIREKGKDWSSGGPGIGIEPTFHYGADNGGNEGLAGIAARYKNGTQTAGRNRRSVWNIATQPYSEAHFATFPPKLIEPCILAGSPPKCCGECGAPWERIVERGEPELDPRVWSGKGQVAYDDDTRSMREMDDLRPNGTSSLKHTRTHTTSGWRTTCSHDDPKNSLQVSDKPTVPSTVLDPFAGAGTTGLVATQHGRDFIGIELNPEYAEMARERIRRYEANPAGALEGDPEPIEGQIGLL